MKRPATRSVEYSDTFKKTFLSVQKEIIRRDIHKRQLIILQNQTNRNVKKSYSMMDNIQGKKIKLS